MPIRITRDCRWYRPVNLLIRIVGKVSGFTAVSGYFSPNMHRLRAKTVRDRRVSDVLPLCIGHSQLEETSTVVSSKHKSPKRELITAGVSTSSVLPFKIICSTAGNVLARVFQAQISWRRSFLDILQSGALLTRRRFTA